ncbi:unnamed protein product [Pleuronectes platessa]|uniref:Telomerase-binding protein EST1A n=1 Tax=Pleuronectes platessa TaxID=8262 RepID=A0A9N7YVQ1_PLEPL|nr:unnamed protein product [Pleuronectes platessa]
MADELDRVRISAAELRAEASSAGNSTDCQKDEQHVPKQHLKREAKRPDQQRFKPAAGHGRHHHDSDEGETCQSDPPATCVHEHDKPMQSEKKAISEKVSDSTDGGTGTDFGEEDRVRGDGSNTQNRKKGSHSRPKMEANQEKSFVENDKEPLEPAGAAKPVRKARKPDRELYQPGTRRSTQGKEYGVGKEQDTPPPGKQGHKTDPEAQSNTEEMEVNKKTSPEKPRGKVKEVKDTQENVKVSKSSETNRKQGSRDVQKPLLPPDASVEKMTCMVEKLSMKEKGKVGSEGQDVGELSCRRGKTTEKGGQGQRGGEKEEEEKIDRTRGNCRRRGGEKEKEGNRDGISDLGKDDKARDRRAVEADRDNKPAKTVETNQSKLRENRGENRRGGDYNNNRSREAEKDVKTEKNVDRIEERVNRNQFNANITPSSSKRYSKSDIRRPRNRTYSSSSASSVTSLEGPGVGMNLENTKWPRLHPKLNNKEKMATYSDGQRRHLKSWTTNGESSTESLERSEKGDVAENRKRRRRGGEDELSAARRREERKGNRGGDDEVAGSPPVPQGEHLRSQQTAAIAHYKFQNSDNPYGYPMPTSSPHSPGNTTSQRYPYPYHIGPYQTAPPSNGMYPGPGMGQIGGSYKGAAYSQPGAGGSLSFQEVEQQARGELGKLLRNADTQELLLSNLLSRDRVSADGLDRMAQLRGDLLRVYEQVILTDIEFSDSQNLDQALWKNVFYQVIERFRQLLKDPASDNTPHIRNMLLTLLDEGSLFFDALLLKLQTVYQFKLEDYMDGMAIRARPLRKMVKYALISAQRCMICQGDIARYREQASDSANYGKARSWYLKAQQIAPKNGRPYNQLALLAVYTKRKLDAVYYYMRSLAASNPILTAKESLMSLFEEAKRKTEQLEGRRKKEHEGGSRGPPVRGRGRGEEGARVEIWIRPSAQAATPSSHRGGSESSRDSELDGELGSLSASDLNKRFILRFLHAHGKLFTKVGMESFPGVASRVLQEFKKLLQHGPSLLGSTHMLQIITINMFSIHNAHSRDEGGDVRSVLQEQSTALGLGMFALLVQRCTELLKDTPAEPVPMANGEEDGKGQELEGMLRVSAFPRDLKELLPSIKVWSDWMLGQPDQWNPPPCSIDGSPNVWQCLADLCNMLARVDHEEVPLFKADTDEGEGDEELTVLQLKEDRLLAGFVPILAAPQEACYTDSHTDMTIAEDCKRVTVLKYFLEALCGQEEPLLAFKGGKYISVATSSPPDHSANTGGRQGSHTEKEADDVIVEAESSLSTSEGEEEADDSENDIRQLKARRHVLTNKLAQQQKRKEKIQAVLQTGGQLELEVRPRFLVPDTNGFIDHLEGLQKLLKCRTYIIVLPLIVITELDGLAKGQDNFGGGVGSGGRNSGSRGNHNVSSAHVRSVQEKARLAVAFLEKGFEAREPCLRALTSRGSQLESIAFRSEDTSGQQGNNDDVILSCCLHYCKDKAKDFMPEQRNGTVRLHREVVLLTDDRNLRVKALTRNVPVRDISAFLSWAKSLCSAASTGATSRRHPSPRPVRTHFRTRRPCADSSGPSITADESSAALA